MQDVWALKRRGFRKMVSDGLVTAREDSDIYEEDEISLKRDRSKLGHASCNPLEEAEVIVGAGVENKNASRTQEGAWIQARIFNLGRDDHFRGL